jgi:DNA-directed RNA polymerase subunit RPC12/RpoP
MQKYICKNCGAQYDPSLTAPAECKICSDERQYVPKIGQQWTTLDELLQGEYRNTIKKEEPNLYSIKTVPQVGIGQNAYLITTEFGNYLWDCITYIDEDTKQSIDALGGIDGIILSHPHYYSTIVEWADAFECPIYIHDRDREWLTRSGSDKYIFWGRAELALTPELKILNLGGHFPGSSVLYWENNQQGVLLVGDTIFIVPDQGWVSFLYSHPNRIPLPSFEVKRMIDMLSDFQFGRIYGAFDQSILQNGKEAVLKSAERYIYHVERKDPIQTT